MKCTSGCARWWSACEAPWRDGALSAESLGLTRTQTLKVLLVLERIAENYARAEMLLTTEQKQPLENVACRRGTAV